MKNLLLFCLLACGLPFAVCAQAKLKKPRKSPVDSQVYILTQSSPGIGLAYIDQAECRAKFEKDALLNRWSEDEKLREWAKIPAGGYLQASWGRSTPSTASADSFVFLIESSDGKQKMRWKPELSIPRPMHIMGVTVYSETTNVPLDAPLVDGDRVFIVEAWDNKRHEFAIHP